MDWKISKHARLRFTQRFKLYFKAYHFTAIEETNMLMVRLLDSAKMDKTWLNCPFYVNKVFSVYGEIEIWRINAPTNICFIVDAKTNTVKTVVKDFDPKAVIRNG